MKIVLCGSILVLNEVYVGCIAFSRWRTNLLSSRTSSQGGVGYFVCGME